MRKVGKRLVAAGTRPSTSASKLARALPGRHPAETGRVTVAETVRRYLAEQHQALGGGHVSLRLGLDPVHTTRVATRRLRSTLRVFGELFDSAAAAHLDGELAWYAQLLGQVRDPQVQRARFAAAVGSLPPGLVLGPVAAHIEERLLSEQLHHHDQLMAALDTARYRELLATVASWASDPPLTVPVGEDPDGLFRLAPKADRTAHRRLRTGLASGDDLALHRARKAAKRARYAAELVAPLPGTKAAKAAIKHHKKVQTVLGEHQDSVVALDLLRRLGAEAGTTPGQNGFTYGLLYAHQQTAARRSRTAAADLTG